MKLIEPSQIPKFWNAIKFAALSVDPLEEPAKGIYLNKLLSMLLSGNAQCFVRVENDQLLAIILTSFKGDETTGNKIFSIGCIYSFQSVDLSRWISDLEQAKIFAKQNNCTKIVIGSKISRAQDLIVKSGFSEEYRLYSMTL